MNSRKPVLGSMKSQSTKKANGQKLAKRARLLEVLERRELMTFSPGVLSALGTMLFTDQASYESTGQILQARYGGGSSGSHSGGEGNAPTSYSEVEPNNVRATANYLPLGNETGKNPVVNVTGQMQNIFDQDFFAFDLKKGDILDVSSTVPPTGGIPALTLFNTQGVELLYSKQLFYPSPVGRPISTKTPLSRAGASTLSYIIDTDGRYYLSVSDAAGS